MDGGRDSRTRKSSRVCSIDALRGTVWLVQRLPFDPGQNSWLIGIATRFHARACSTATCSDGHLHVAGPSIDDDNSDKVCITPEDPNRRAHRHGPSSTRVSRTMSDPTSGTHTPAIHVSDSRLRSGDLDQVNNALAALQGKDAAAPVSTAGARSASFGAGGPL